jgi:hypothetical protein
MHDKGIWRGKANTQTIQYFLPDFQRENITLITNFIREGERANFASFLWYFFIPSFSNDRYKFLPFLCK